MHQVRNKQERSNAVTDPFDLIRKYSENINDEVQKLSVSRAWSDKETNVLMA